MTFTLDNLRKQDNFFLMAGPCVIENEDMALQIAEKITDITSRLNIPYILFTSGLIHWYWRRESPSDSS